MKFLISLLVLLLLLLGSVIYIFSTSNVTVIPSFESNESSEQNLSNPKEVETRFQNEYFESKWEDTKEKLDQALEKYTELDRTQEGNFFWDKRASLKDELNAIFKELITELHNEHIDEYKEEIAGIREEINEDRIQIKEYRDEMKEAPKESYVSTTVEEYKEDIKEVQKSIKEKQQYIANREENIHVYFYLLGIELSYQKISVLSTRSDFHYIHENALLLTMLNTVVKKMLKNLKLAHYSYAATRYYHNMNRIIFELIIYQQNRYIQRIEDKEKGYIAQLNNLIAYNKELYESAKSDIKRAKHAEDKKIHKSNMKATTLFIKTAKKYKKDMLQQRKRLLKARIVADRHLKLSQKRYRITLSSLEVLKPTRDLEKVLKKIMHQYLKEIDLSFESQAVAKRYLKITKQL